MQMQMHIWNLFISRKSAFACIRIRQIWFYFNGVTEGLPTFLSGLGLWADGKIYSSNCHLEQASNILW